MISICNVLLYSFFMACCFLQKKLTNEKILGFQLATEEEMATLIKAYQLSGGQPGTAGGGYGGVISTVISWLTILLDEALTKHAGYFNEDIGKPRRTALSMAFQANVERLRSAAAKLGYCNQLPVPLAYTQLMQLCVDTVCLIFPFSMVYEVNTEIIASSGFNSTKLWGQTFVFVVFTTFLFAFIYQGLMCIAKCMTNPAGLCASAPHQPKHAPNVGDKEMFLEVRSLLNQARVSTRAYFNAGAFLPGK